MLRSHTRVQSARERNLLFLSRPDLWPVWPYLPLVKRVPGQPEVEGVLFDALKACNVAGHSATVFIANYFLLPSDLAGFLALPKEVFDTPEEIFNAGWSVD